MSEPKLIKPTLCAAMALAAIGAVASAAEPTSAEIREQIEALQRKVEQIEKRESSAAEQQATSMQVLEDASRRSQLLQSGGFTGGYDGKEFFLGSADGNFRLAPIFQFQARSVTNFGEDTDDGDDSIESGFEIRRMKFGIKGNAFSKALKYEFRWATNRNGGELVLDSAHVVYALNDTWSLKAGQWKDNVFHEESVSSSRQLGVDRSMVNEEIGGGNTDYIQGVGVLFKADAIRAEVAFHDGANSDNTNFEDRTGGVGDLDPNFGVSGRAEYKISGDWKSYDDFTSLKNKDDLFVLGAGANYTEGGDTLAIYHTVDAQWESGSMPLSAYAALLGQYVEDGEEDGYNWGGLVQVGYMLDDRWEAFGRFSYTDLDGDGSYQEYTVGTNYYFHGHNAKATVDVVLLPDGTPGADTGIGVLAGDDFQAVLRAQFQLAL